jgi:long-chain acyl-CoA synthetase
VSPDAIGYSRFDGSQWTDISNDQFWNQVQQLARGFIAAGIEAGDCVGIMSRTRYEWTLVDFALWTAGAIPVPIYDSSSADQVHWILSDSGAVACIVETPRNAKTVDQSIADLANVTQVWCITDNDLDTLAARGDEVPKEVLDQRRASLNVDSLATIIYTSGTTGRPKGCELTHGNFLACAQNAVAALPDVVGVEGASTLLFLPLAHVFARFVEVLCVAGNVRLAHTATITDLAGKLQSFQPTFLLAVPRVFEKLYVGAQQKATADGKGAIFQRATDVAIAYSQGIQAGRIPFAVKTQHAVFEKLVYSKLRNAMGGQIRWAVSGGAPLGERLGHFFRGAGVTMRDMASPKRRLRIPSTPPA